MMDITHGMSLVSLVRLDQKVKISPDFDHYPQGLDGLPGTVHQKELSFGV
jgi:hypothetical protein